MPNVVRKPMQGACTLWLAKQGVRTEFLGAATQSLLESSADFQLRMQFRADALRDEFGSSRPPRFKTSALEVDLPVQVESCRPA